MRTRAIVLLRRPRVRLALGAVVILAALGAGGWTWFRDSSFAAVKNVIVTGQSGPDAAAIRSALTTAAGNMSTLDVDSQVLRTAVSPYPVVQALIVRTEFPHTMRIRVVEQLPVAVIQTSGRSIAVAADGILLRDLASDPALPRIRMAVPPGGPRLTDPGSLSAVAALSAAPYPLLSRISQVQSTASHGLVAQLRAGPAVYLGSLGQLTQKWAAAIAILADHGSAGAAYIDVTDPRRPAAGADIRR